MQNSNDCLIEITEIEGANRLKNDRKLGIKVFNNIIKNIVNGYNYGCGNVICDISRQEQSCIDVFIMYLADIINDLKR